MSNTRGMMKIDCPFSGVIEYVERFFARRHKLPLTAFKTIGTKVTTEYSVIIDQVDTARRHDALEVAWFPAEHLPLPAFRGVLSVRPDSKGSLLALEGAYEPPLGKVGKVFDKAVGSNIAQGTVNGLLQEIKMSVEEQWNEERSRMPDIETLNERQSSNSSERVKKKSH